MAIDATSLINTILGAGVATYGAIKGTKESAKYANQADKQTEEQRARNKAYYDMQINSDPSQRSEWLATKKMVNDIYQNRFNAAQKSKIVTGGTDASITQEQIAAANALGETATSVMAQESSRKDALSQAQMQTDNQFAAQQIAGKQQRASDAAQAASTAVSAGLGMMGNGLSTIKKKQA